MIATINSHLSAVNIHFLTADRLSLIAFFYAIRFGHALRVHPDDLEAYILDKRLDYGRNAQEFLRRHRSDL